MPYEILDHTADLLLRVTADTCEELIDEARLGLYACVGDLSANRNETARSEPCVIDIQCLDFCEVFHDWLAELLYRLDSKHQLCVPISAYEVDQHHLRAHLSARPLDFEASHLDREVKAVTYHELFAGRRGDGWVATVVLDI